MNKIFLGNTELKKQANKIAGQFVEIENEKFYKISNYMQMPDFFMTIVSDSDHWMYLSSNGALSAGRKNRDNALFPYYTVDKIHDYRNITGSKTYSIIEKNGKSFWWEPFTDESGKVYNIERNLYKSIYGNKVIFEEINHDFEVCFQYSWQNSERFGWVKKSNIKNQSNSNVKIHILDGIRNILPYGVDYLFQNEYSNLLDAYKKNELLKNSSLGLFMLSSIPVDRAEPSEALKTTSVWSLGGNEISKILVSDKQLDNFKNGLNLENEFDVRASRGAYYLYNSFNLESSNDQSWLFAAEINQDSRDIANLKKFLQTQKNIDEQINDDIKTGTENLKKIVGAADGLQIGNEELGFARHFSNTLYNVMRGGIFSDNYSVNTEDFRLYVNQTNTNIEGKFQSQLSQLPQKLTYSELVSWAQKENNSDLERIALEYLPLTFSRRHGDPSRPWNVFSIETKNTDGTDKLNYQGNWRDIFQNWEALSLSYPEFVEGMISKFLNASTADGYNPYRITREGMDWESPNPDEPWAFIGYWGDHQIIYLQKLLELSNEYHPGKLDDFMTKELFVYANVPYRIKSFEEIKSNPKDTIDFDYELNNDIQVYANKMGADGKLLYKATNEIYKVNLTEKILVTLLAKLSNFVPEAGIWLNTQRPEWNDANNALVGNGVSMVTLYYLRRFLSFWGKKCNQTSVSEISISEEVNALFEKINSLFAENTGLINNGFSDEDRYYFTSYLGNAGDEYRQSIYKKSFSGKKSTIQVSALNDFIELAIKFIDQSIHKNKREDGLYHAYNLITIKEQSISIWYLYEMLEGQVAVLSSGFLKTGESLSVLDSLKASQLFREDQYSYLLYPNRELPRFIEKNNIPQDDLQYSALLQKLVANNESSILGKDKNGDVHFNGAFRNSAVLAEALENLDLEEYGELLISEKESILNVYESIFDHQSFTGRSGTFYGYEGLGSIYWHMVSKLLLATQECYLKGVSEKADPKTLGKLKDHYYEIKAGIGLYKSPELYGAFPTDAYSHTPANAGAKQPGLTGQVKEDIIARFGELGVEIADAKISFNPSILNSNEVLTNDSVFSYFNLKGKQESIELKAGQLGFTICQVPVVYNFGEEQKVVVEFSDNKKSEFKSNELPEKISNEIFSRSDEIKRISVYLKN